MNSSSKERPNAIAWWLHPSVIVFLFVAPAYIAIWISGEITDGSISSSKAYFYLKGQYAWLGLIGIITLGIGTLSPIRPLYARTTCNTLNANVLIAIGYISLAGYAYWFKDLLINPAAIWNAINADSSVTFALRSSVAKEAGIASFAQVGLAYILAFSYTKCTDRNNTLRRHHEVVFVLILLATLFRAFAWAERVALIELVLGLMFPWVIYRRHEFSKRTRNLINKAPIFGVIFTISIFAVGEYFRSWTAYYAKQGQSFLEFIFQRLANYYFNGLNTGAGRLYNYDWPTFDFLYTLRWLHKLPIIGPIFSSLMDAKSDNFLYRYGDPEFNNPSALFSIFFDLGLPLGLVIILLIGVLSKFLYNYLRHGENFAGLFYFIFLMTFLEFFRYFYIGDSRAFMPIAGLLALTLTRTSHEKKINDPPRFCA